MHLVVEQPEAISKAFEADFLRVPHHASSRSIRAMARADLARRLPEVKSPTLLVFGDPSHVVRAAYGNAMMAKLPRSRLVHIAGTSHCPMIEAPASFYGAVREFLDVDLNGRVAKPPAATYTSP
jgi:pimeloyl-ACP methyl ester carboxylesterase